MNKTKFHFQHFILIMSLIMTAMPSLTFADAAIEKQKADCLKNTAYEWSNSLNRCVGKTAAREKRHEAQDCNKIADIPQREACHIRLAEKATGLSSNTDSLYQGNKNSTIPLGITAIAGFIFLTNFSNSKNSLSACTSSRIFGVTAIAGLATDLYLKMKAKKKVEDLANKYHLDAKSSASNSQVKALEYLKEEQETVVEIAGEEKKRDMLLGIGYTAAGIMAAVELINSEAYPECVPVQGGN